MMADQSQHPASQDGGRRKVPPALAGSAQHKPSSDQTKPPSTRDAALAAGAQPRPNPAQTKSSATRGTTQSFKYALWHPRFSREITGKDDFSKNEVSALSKILISLHDHPPVFELIRSVKANNDYNENFKILKRAGKHQLEEALSVLTEKGYIGAPAYPKIWTAKGIAIQIIRALVNMTEIICSECPDQIIPTQETRENFIYCSLCSRPMCSNCYPKEECLSFVRGRSNVVFNCGDCQITTNAHGRLPDDCFDKNAAKAWKKANSQSDLEGSEEEEEQGEEREGEGEEEEEEEEEDEPEDMSPQSQLVQVQVHPPPPFPPTLPHPSPPPPSPTQPPTLPNPPPPPPTNHPTYDDQLYQQITTSILATNHPTTNNQSNQDTIPTITIEDHQPPDDQTELEDRIKLSINTVIALQEVNAPNNQIVKARENLIELKRIFKNTYGRDFSFNRWKPHHTTKPTNEEHTTTTQVSIPSLLEKTIQPPNLEEQVDQTTNPDTCKFYRAGRCQFGISGRNVDGGKCKFTHPRICQRYHSQGLYGCKLGKKCRWFHPRMCSSSMNQRTCFNPECKYIHIKGTSRVQPNHQPSRWSNQQQNHQTTKQNNKSTIKNTNNHTNGSTATNKQTSNQNQSLPTPPNPDPNPNPNPTGAKAKQQKQLNKQTTKESTNNANITPIQPAPQPDQAKEVKIQEDITELKEQNQIIFQALASIQQAIKTNNSNQNTNQSPAPQLMDGNTVVPGHQQSSQHVNQPHSSTNSPPPSPQPQLQTPAVRQPTGSNPQPPQVPPPMRPPNNQDYYRQAMNQLIWAQQQNLPPPSHPQGYY